MAKSRLPYVNLALTATVAASSEVSNRPASFLKNSARWKKWRSSTTTGDQNVQFDFASTSVKSVVLVDWKKHGTTGTIKAEYWDGGAWQLFGTFTLPAFNPTRTVAVWNAGQTTTKIRVFFTNVGAVSDYVELGVAVIGTYLEPSYSLIDGFELTPVDPSQKVAALGGQESGESRRHFFVAHGRYEHMPDADKLSLLTMFDTVGTLIPFVFAVNPDNADEVLYCTVSDWRMAHAGPAPTGNYWNVDLAVQEAR